MKENNYAHPVLMLVQGEADKQEKSLRKVKPATQSKYSYAIYLQKVTRRFGFRKNLFQVHEWDRKWQLLSISIDLQKQQHRPLVVVCGTVYLLLCSKEGIHSFSSFQYISFEQLKITFHRNGSFYVSLYMCVKSRSKNRLLYKLCKHSEFLLQWKNQGMYTI